MNHRHLAFVLSTSTFALTTALASEGRADECGSGHAYIAENAVITLTPSLPCVKPRVAGKSSGCEDLVLLYENQCAEPIFLPSREIPPGMTGESRLYPSGEGSHTFETTITHEGQTIAVVVTADIVDIACSVSAPGGRAPAGWAWALGLAAVAWGARRRRGSL